MRRDEEYTDSTKGGYDHNAAYVISRLGGLVPRATCGIG